MYMHVFVCIYMYVCAYCSERVDEEIIPNEKVMNMVPHILKFNNNYLEV